MSPSATLPHSMDLSHHLTPRVRAATPNKLKAIGSLMADPTLMSLAGGLPHKSLFPTANLSFTIPTRDSLDSIDVSSWVAGESDLSTVQFSKDGPGIFSKSEKGLIDLSRVMQYGMTSAGYPELISKLLDLTYLVHGRPYEDVSIYITLGCTDGVSKTFSMFCEPGDRVLCEEFSFGSSLNSGRAKGVEFVPVKVDGEGLIPEDLERILDSWNDSMGKKERYDAIYTIAQKHDLIIMEDDPYFPLQYRAYQPDTVKREQELQAARLTVGDSVLEVAKSYNEYAGVKSFVSRDTDGRVVRLDTFSKVFGPGLRLGWITCSSLFAERFARLGETTTSSANNVSQTIMLSVLSDEQWGIEGWLKWCFAVRLEYQRKRDFFLDVLRREAPSEYVETVPAGGGMFQWLRINVEKHPRYNAAKGSNTAGLMQELFECLLKDKVVALPGWIFSADGGDNVPLMRTTFAGSTEQMDQALTQFGKTVKAFFEA